MSHISVVAVITAPRGYARNGGERLVAARLVSTDASIFVEGLYLHAPHQYSTDALGGTSLYFAADIRHPNQQK